jgi:hypothetical protein
MKRRQHEGHDVVREKGVVALGPGRQRPRQEGVGEEMEGESSATKAFLVLQ